MSSTALIGFACDEGVLRNNGRPGASEGPKKIRQYLKRKPNQDLGDVLCSERDLEKAQRGLAEKVSDAISKHCIPVVLGGGHETAWGHYQGIEPHAKGKSLGIVNFDAHFDLRPLIDGTLGSSGTPFLQIAERCRENQREFHYSLLGIQPNNNSESLFKTASELKVQFQTAQSIYEQPLSVMQYWLRKRIQSIDNIYLSICMDVFSSAVAPGVSAVQPLGLMPWQVLGLIHPLLASGKVMAVDIVELCPKHDHDDITAKLAAALVDEILRGIEPCRVK